ncbi:hypothetical protein BSF37_22055 [Serratia marcescens]|nr:hypothetical protein [Serratia marcescens]
MLSPNAIAHSTVITQIRQTSHTQIRQTSHTQIRQTSHATKTLRIAKRYDHDITIGCDSRGTTWHQ